MGVNKLAPPTYVRGMAALQRAFTAGTHIRQQINRFRALARGVSGFVRLGANLARGRRAVDEFLQAVGPGSLIADVTLVRMPHAPEADRADAVRRLAREHVTFRGVFHHTRRLSLRRPFNEWRGGRPDEDAWEDLAGVRILEAVAELTDDTLLTEVWPSLRRRIRPAIETDLIGRTLDMKAKIVGLNAAAFSVHSQTRESPQFLDLAAALQTLSPQDRDILRGYAEASSAERRAQAASLGITPEALRQRVAAIRRRLRILVR